MIPLYQHQKSLLEKNPHKWLLAWGTGSAKTRTAIELAAKNCNSVLVICPKALPLKWRREIDVWVNVKSACFDVLTKEKFRARWQDVPAYDCVIVDEAHHHAGFRNTRNMSAMHKSLFLYFNKHKIEYRYLLTATPYLSSPMNIFALSRLLGQNWSYSRFKEHFFYDVMMGHRIIPMIRPHMENDLKDLVNQLGNTVSLDEVFDVPDQVFEKVEFELTDNQKAGIKNLTDSNFIVRWTKTHQIEQGVLKGDEYTEAKHFECLKNDYIASLCEENAKVAVFCRYTLQIEELRELLELKFPGKPIYVIQGDTKDRDAVVTEVEKAPECVVLINASCSEGYELPSIGVIIFASLSFSHKDHIQGMGRFQRINALKKNVYIYLIGGEVDQGVYDCIMKKQDFHLELFNKEKL